MIIDWIIAIILILSPIVFSVIDYILSKRKKEVPPPKNLLKYYLLGNIELFVLAVILVLLNFGLLIPDFSSIDKGIFISEDIVITTIMIFLVPFFLAFLPTDINFPKNNIQDAKVIFGFETALMPKTFFQVIPFAGFLIIGVVLEELIFRQFMFASFSSTLGIEGDLLVLFTAFLFAIGHFYQGAAGMFFSFLLGLATGKMYLLTENIMVPIFMHLCVTLTVVVYAVRRMILLRRLEKRG